MWFALFRYFKTYLSKHLYIYKGMRLFLIYRNQVQNLFARIIHEIFAPVLVLDNVLLSWSTIMVKKRTSLIRKFYRIRIYKSKKNKISAQTYSMDCYFRQSWVDRRLAFQGGKETLALSISMLARIWKPDTYFYNGKHSYLHTITSPNKFVRLYQDGRVLYSSR